MGFDFVRLRIDERADVGFLGEIAGAAIAVALGQRGGAGHGGVGEAIERVVSEGFVDVADAIVAADEIAEMIEGIAQGIVAIRRGHASGIDAGIQNAGGVKR